MPPDATSAANGAKSASATTNGPKTMAIPPSTASTLARRTRPRDTGAEAISSGASSPDTASQARRSLFRRRQVSSRLATFSEALSSIGWAGTGALAATGTWLAIIPGLFVLAIVGGAWLISPVRSPTLI